MLPNESTKQKKVEEDGMLQFSDRREDETILSFGILRLESWDFDCIDKLTRQTSLLIL